MTLNTDFNITPYFDDYDEEKDFYRILMKPEVAIQARELTQLQTILQKQIERFGTNVFKEGAIIKGGNFVELSPLPYVKILDDATNTNSETVPVSVSSYKNLKAVGQSTGIEAIIIETSSGLESQTPNLNTLHVKYINNAQSGNTNVGTFSDTEEIVIQQLNANNIYEDYQTVTAAGTIDENSIGEGYGVRCGDGIIYQKGFFLRFEDDVTVVSKYDPDPDGLVVGFETEETIINSSIDTSLLDNASGFNNENAPGADRIKLTPSLVVKTLAEAEADPKFFAIQEYLNGEIVSRARNEYNRIMDIIERRTREINGNFSVDKYRMIVENNSANSNNLNLKIAPGKAYVEGKRVSTFTDNTLILNKATDFNTVEDEDVITNYGHYLIANTITGDFGFDSFANVNLKSSNTTVGTARIRNLNKRGDDYRLYVFDIEMNSNNNFTNIDEVEDPSNGGSATIELTSGEPIIEDYSFLNTIFKLGKDSIKTVNAASAEYEYRVADRGTASDAAGEIVVTVADGVLPYSTGSLNSDQIEEIIVVADAAVGNNSIGDYLVVDSVTVDSTTQMTIQLDSADVPGSSMDVVVYYNAKKDGFNTNVKTLKTVYVKIDTDTNEANTVGPYCLGMPDVYSLEGVWVGNTYSESETSAISSFSINNNQKDTHYDLSKLKKKKGYTLGGTKILAKVKVFQKTSGNTCFTFNSYSANIDDSSETLPDNKIRTEGIPTYISKSTGEEFYLRDVVDFRPFAANTAAYSTTIGSATENPNSAVTFTASDINFPTPNKIFETDYQYYYNRKDVVFLDSDGGMTVIKGIPDDEPITPVTPERGLRLAEISIPGYPSLPSTVANAADKPDYGVSIKDVSHKGYTMKEIGKIEKRVENLEYYTSLSLLEQTTKDLLITDTNGLNRFKNGIFVDNFENLRFSDVKDSEFSASVDSSNKEMNPKIRQIPFDLKFLSSNNTTDYGEVTVLDNTTTTIIEQPYATKSRSCTTDFYNFKGSMSLDPEYDSATDTTRAPDINFDVDLTGVFTNFTNTLNQFIPMQRTSSAVVSQTQSAFVDARGVVSRTQQTIQDTIRSFNVGEGSEITRNIGDFVTDVDFNPFLRSREVKIRINGLRPSTRFYFFFDGKNVDEHIANAILSNDDLIRSSNYSANNELISDSNGDLYAIFRIPEGEFPVGDRVLEVHDVSDYNSIDSSTSSAKKVYSGFNFSVERTGFSSTTRIPDFNISTSTRNRTNVTDVVIPPAFAFNNGDGDSNANQDNDGDPLAQTFYVDQNYSQDTSVFVSKVDLYFHSKSSVGRGVTVQLREVENGYPSSATVPFATVHLDANTVNANSTTANTATTVTFKNPVALKVGREYAIIIKPDGNDPDYRAWVSKTGGTDIDTNISITQDNNSGVIFTSTNNRTWTPYQDENLKFKLYKTVFSNNSGSVTLTTNDIEFLKVSNTNGSFLNGEYVFVEGSALTGNVSVTAGNTTIVGDGTTFSTDYTVGEFIVIETSNNTFEPLKISSIANNTSLAVTDIPIASNTDTTHFKSVVGKAYWYTNAEPELLVLEESTAKSGLVFEANTTVMGALSGANTYIDEVADQEVSYIQSSIGRANFTQTETSLEFTKLWDGSTTYSKNGNFEDNNYLSKYETYLRSRSNEISDVSGRTFNLKVNMSNKNPNSRYDTSPMIDHKISNIVAYHNVINNDNTDEVTSDGDASSKYISKPVTLSDGLDADNIRVLLTGYRPPGTDLEVYVKLLASSDSTDFDDLPWSLMSKKDETSGFSSKVNRFDFKEFEYNLGTTVKAAGEGAYSDGDNIVYISESGAEYTSFTKFAVKVVYLSTGHNLIPRMKNIRVIAVS